MNFLDYLPELLSAILGGGLVTLFTLPEKKKAAQLENDRLVIEEYASLIEKYRTELGERDKRIDALQKRIEELEAKAATERHSRDERIAELEAQVRELQGKLYDLQNKRDSRGRFTKSNQKANEVQR